MDQLMVAKPTLRWTPLIALKQSMKCGTGLIPGRYRARAYEEDEIIFTIPKGYRLDSEPLKKSINRPFGSFHVTMTVDGDQIKYTRKFQVKEGTYSKDVYEIWLIYTRKPMMPTTML